MREYLSDVAVIDAGLPGRRVSLKGRRKRIFNGFLPPKNENVISLTSIEERKSLFGAKCVSLRKRQY